MEIFEAIKALTQYAINEKLIEKEDEVYCINSLCQVLNIDFYEDADIDGEYTLEEILSSMLDYAVKNGLCEDSIVYRDLFDTKIMGVLTPRPSQVIKTFYDKYAISPKAATDYYYKLARRPPLDESRKPARVGQPGAFRRAGPRPGSADRKSVV